LNLRSYLLPLLALLCFLGWGLPNSLRAEDFSLEIMGGSALNFPTPLTVRQSGYPDIHLTANYDTKPFGPYTPYYAWRASFWNGQEAWEIGQVHHRIFLTNPPPEIQVFAIHFGYNYFFLGHAWKRGGLIYHLAVGPIIANPENTVRGLKLHTAGTGLFDAGYDFSGIGAEASLSKNIYLSNNFFISLEAAFIAGWAWWVPIVDGSADVPNTALHGHIGTGFSF